MQLTGFSLSYFFYFSEKNHAVYFYVEKSDTKYRIRKDVFVRLFNEVDWKSKARTKRFITKKKLSSKFATANDIQRIEKRDIIAESE